MPAVPEPADSTVLDLLRHLTRTVDRHRPLFDAAVRINVLMMEGDDGHGIVHRGHPAAACIRILNLKQRYTTGFDAEIEICKDWWRDTPAEREGLLFHELCHVTLAGYGYTPILNARGEPTGELEIKCKRDRLGRPKLKSVRGDVMVGDAFKDCIARYGDKAPERVAARRFLEWTDLAMRGDGEEPTTTIPINRTGG